MWAAQERPASCPACGSPRVASILYGLAQFTPELERELAEGRVVLGGCVVFDESPKWQCAACGQQWGRLEWGPPAADDDRA
jgi:hypothetical protein